MTFMTMTLQRMALHKYGVSLFIYSSGKCQSVYTTEYKILHSSEVLISNDIQKNDTAEI
jgi:hypothetical protein